MYLSKDEIDRRFDQLIEYWHSLRQGDDLPKRTDFRPEKIYKLMPAVTLCDCYDQSNVIYRLVGTEVASRLGRDPTGENAMAWVPQELHDDYGLIADKIFSHPCAGRWVWQTKNVRGKIIESHNLHLPMQGKSESLPCLLNISYATESIGYGEENFEFSMGLIPTVQYINLGWGLPEKTIYIEA